MGYWGYAPYVSVAEKKAKAARKLQQLKKKNPHMRPVLVQGYKLAKTWWGKSWNLNLERYADYAYRIERGRSYVRHGCVMDLRIEAGLVEALVQGTASKPYSVSVEIQKISKDRWKAITRDCQGKLESLQELLEGKFPRALGEIFTAKGKGLFPSPREINFSCSCPDWASMCKHVAATLYGIGARLDENPSLFFELRGAEIDELVSHVVTTKARKLLTKAKKKSGRVMDDSNLSEVFGIDLEEGIDQKDPTAVGTVKNRAAKRQAQRPSKKTSAIYTVEKIIRRSRKGIDIASLKQKTGFDERKIYNTLQRLKKQGKIKNVSRGVYLRA